MDRPEIEQKLRAIVVEHLGVDAGNVTRESSMIDDLGADSLDLVELTLPVAEDLNVELEDEDLDKISTFGDLVDVVEQKLAA